jgi:hypothetical protein
MRQLPRGPLAAGIVWALSFAASQIVTYGWDRWWIAPLSVAAFLLGGLLGLAWKGVKDRRRRRLLQQHPYWVE